jgi:hypothetical protein
MKKEGAERLQLYISRKRQGLPPPERAHFAIEVTVGLNLNFQARRPSSLNSLSNPTLSAKISILLVYPLISLQYVAQLNTSSSWNLNLTKCTLLIEVKNFYGSLENCAETWDAWI